MTILPDAGSKTSGSSSARWRLPIIGSYAGNISCGVRHGPSRSIMLIMVTSPIESLFMRSLDLLAASKNPTGSQLAARLHSQREAYMPEDNPARKSFEAGARAAREAAGRGTAAAEQATRQTDQSYTSVADVLREFNAKLLDIAPGQYDGRHEFRRGAALS